ncbi:M48 family metallopeptidase [Undibacterium sp. TS12]|uniref:M48 family metallopeptidase n=1 Tax=Undibacterium sp. TS12 TaxID=2908202 RepID=UPI001F4C5CEE|nr:M48 family metallopeptidase [Undibacterium sp. TS12]MCH8622075.1 M48 family metalloprotease [Undibacterium sp. TS12]
MSAGLAFKKDLAKILLYSLLSLFLIPVFTYWFAEHVESRQDKAFIDHVTQQIATDPSLNPEEKVSQQGFFISNPPSRICDNTSPEAASYRDSVCARYSDNWQFIMARKIAIWTIVGGAALLLSVLILSALAFLNEKIQYLSFVAGWRLITLSSAAGTMAQGAMLMWLSFWVTAYFMHSYSIKLIAVAVIFVAIAVFYVIVNIFKRVHSNNQIQGELIPEQAAPGLWRHIRDLAARLKTAAPDHIVAGIDANFFVTESPLNVSGRSLRGRSLFISIPLLRLLSQSEADAVLAHELAHFRGGDTANSAALGPKLAQYDQYCREMGNAHVVTVFYLMCLYRMIFEIASARNSRDREFLADRIAAKVVAPAAVVNSLIKVAAYATYRSDIENQLFSRNEQQGNRLGIAQFVASGLYPYAQSSDFLNTMKDASVPHPYDSHPKMSERMKNVGHVVAESQYGSIVTSVPVQTWATDIQTADEIENRLWTEYEENFSQAHEHSLAYRFEPANEEERELVLRYFPPVEFSLSEGKSIQVTYAGWLLPDEKEPLPWDRVSTYEYEDGMLADTLTIKHPEKGMLGPKSTKVKLSGIKKVREEFKNVSGHYWHRHQVMRHLQLSH